MFAFLFELSNQQPLVQVVMLTDNIMTHLWVVSTYIVIHIYDHVSWPYLADTILSIVNLIFQLLVVIGALESIYALALRVVRIFHFSFLFSFSLQIYLTLFSTSSEYQQQNALSESLLPGNPKPIPFSFPPKWKYENWCISRKFICPGSTRYGYKHRHIKKKTNLSSLKSPLPVPVSDSNIKKGSFKLGLINLCSTPTPWSLDSLMDSCYGVRYLSGLAKALKKGISPLYMADPSKPIPAEVPDWLIKQRKKDAERKRLKKYGSPDGKKIKDPMSGRLRTEKWRKNKRAAMVVAVESTSTNGARYLLSVIIFILYLFYC